LSDGSACRCLSSRQIRRGGVNLRTDEAESPETRVARAWEAGEFWEPSKIFLNPDCGFAYFANRGVKVEGVAAAKLRSMAEAARRLCGR